MDKNTVADEPLFVRASEASRLTNLPLATIYHRFHKGDLPGVQLGATVLITVAGLRALEKKALGQDD